MKDFQVFLPSTEISMKPVTFSRRFEEGISIKIFKNRKIWNECEKMK